jgi:hypothetical protein
MNTNIANVPGNGIGVYQDDNVLYISTLARPSVLASDVPGTSRRTPGTSRNSENLAGGHQGERLEGAREAGALQFGGREVVGGAAGIARMLGEVLITSNDAQDTTRNCATYKKIRKCVIVNDILYNPVRLTVWRPKKQRCESIFAACPVLLN